MVVLLCLSLTAYFAYHAVYGRHGLEARNRLIERSQLLDFEINSLEAVRAKLERDLALLSPELPAPDIVDEIARDMLGFANPRDKLMLKRPQRTGTP
jgi:cell division protein FtsB